MSVCEYITRFLRFASVVDGRNRSQICDVLGCTPATVTRFLGHAKRNGMRISSGATGYKVTDYGPFDVQKLRQLPWRTMGRKG